MGGLTTPKGRLMRDVCWGLAGFCSVDAQAMAKSAMPDLEIERHVRLSCSKPEALEANIMAHAEDSAPVAQSGHEGVGVAGKQGPCL